MSWDNITGDQRILPTSVGGSQDEVRFESGKAKRLRLIIPPGDEPYSYLEHCIEVETVENGQQVRAFRTARCPKTSDNPNAPCPLCDGQQVRRRTRHVCNVWDYDENKVQKLNAGENVFKPIATSRKLGVDILGVDWGIMKSGSGRNDTEYSTTSIGPSTQPLPENIQLFDVKAEYAPHTVDQMKTIVESIGGDWEKLTNPPQLVYPSLQDALQHVMPNGKYKDQKFSDIWEQDKSTRGYIYYLAMRSDRINEEKAAAQVILANLGGCDIPGVPKNGEAVTTPTASVTPTVAPTTGTSPVQQTQPTNVQQQAQATAGPIQTAPTQTPQPVQNPAPTPAPVDNGRDGKIQEINQLLSSKEAFVKGGFEKVIETMKNCSGGKTNIADFTDAELDKMLETCRNA